ncbi:hypothetical protein KM043_009403 [Ampulex compressa]|nr:hypothetical protein KM043_009403 [Ampulex compressa]
MGGKKKRRSSHQQRKNSEGRGVVCAKAMKRRTSKGAMRRGDSVVARLARRGRSKGERVGPREGGRRKNGEACERRSPPGGLQERDKKRTARNSAHGRVQT